MSLFSDNIRYLRSQKRISQEKLAGELKITRGSYVKYENGATEPPFEILQRIAHYHHLSIDLLLSVDVRKVSVENLLKLDDNRILLPIMMDKQGNNLIEIVPLKAKAGYIKGFGDPIFVQDLPQIALPFLGAGKHRAFPIEGDSMPPHDDAAFIVGKYIESLSDVRKGKTYVFVLPDDIVYKRVGEKKAKSFVFKSDNTDYQSYEVRLSEILEIWEFACSLNMKEATVLNNKPESLEDIVKKMYKDVRDMKEKLDFSA